MRQPEEKRSGFQSTFWILVGLFVAALAIAPSACSPEIPTEELPTEAIDCVGGKCDWADTITRLWKNYDEVDVGDLLTLGAGFATDELNDAMVFGDLAFGFEAPRHFGLEANAVGTVASLDALLTGLTARFGERDLTTEVNRVRRDHLANSDDTVFSEAAFKVKARDLGVTKLWNHEAKGLGLDFVITIGFKAGVEVESRIVAAFENKIEGTGRSMLEAMLMQPRGFIYPTSMDDLRKMKPGELYARRGSGVLAVNVAVGVPLLVAEPISNLTYTLVFSAAFGAGFEGQLDIQAVRMNGDELVVDVGVGAVGRWGGRVAIDDSWGAAGLVQRTIKIAGKVVDLGDIASDAIAEQLNRKLSLLSIHAEATGRGSRLSVARFRFHLDAQSEHLEEALAQTLRGDVRLAQNLAAKGDPGVDAVFDVSRSGVAATSGAGIDILGMSFFYHKLQEEGSVVIQEPGGVLALLFESLEYKGGAIVSKHGYTRTGLAGLQFTPEGATGEANLFVQIAESDYFMQPDKIDDHLDGIILGYAGWEAFQSISVAGNDLEDDMVDIFGDCTLRHYREDCSVSDSDCKRSDFWDVCHREVLSDGYFAACLQQKVGDCRAEPGRDALACARWKFWDACAQDAPANDRVTQAYREVLPVLQNQLAHLDENALAMIGEAIDLRLVTQSLRELPPGPPVEITLASRLDDTALTDVMLSASYQQVKNAVLEYITAQNLNREKQDRADEILEVKEQMWDETGGAVLAIANRFAKAQADYRRIQEYEYANLRTLGNIGARALSIRLTPHESNRETFKALAAESMTWVRARLMTELFDDLVRLGHSVEHCETRRAGDSDTETCWDRLDHEEQLAAYLLLRLTEPQLTELRLDVNMDLDDNFFTDMDKYKLAGYRNVHHYAKGGLVSSLQGGLFDLDSLPHPVLEVD